MSEFKELIKSFKKSREYVRDFFVYGFKSRDDFKEKSGRTYDNERRRIESWLQGFIQQDYTKSGKNISLAIDSNLLDTNPLYRVWKTKSFTDNDLLLHFTILDYLSYTPRATAEQITDDININYDILFDAQTVRRKCNAYEKEGLLKKEKQGKAIYYQLSPDFTDLFQTYPNLSHAISYFQIAAPLGFIGSTIMDNYNISNTTFRVKHSFFVHTLEDEILLELLDAMKQHHYIEIELKSTKQQTVSSQICLPLQIFTSTRSGRRFLCTFQPKSKRFSCIRMDSIKKVSILSKQDTISNNNCHAIIDATYDETNNKLLQETLHENLQDKLIQNHSHIWGVSFQNNSHERLQWIRLTLFVNEQYEQFIIKRLEREGKGGTITRLDDNTFLYEKELFDANEALPWIRTFIGRIIKFECSNPVIEQRFLKDLQAMYQLYDIDIPTTLCNPERVSEN